MSAERTSTSKTPVRLLNVQLYVSSIGLDEARRSEVDRASMELADSLRSWLKSHSVTAPFRKLLVMVHARTLTDSLGAGEVTIMLGVAQVRLFVRGDSIHAEAADLRWQTRRLLDALSQVEKDCGFQSPQLEDFIRKL